MLGLWKAVVAGIVQVGLRGVGSARLTDIEAARHYGSRFVTAREVHAQRIEAALRHIPEGARVVVPLDCDSLDPGIMTGVAARMRSPGHEAARLRENVPGRMPNHSLNARRWTRPTGTPP